MTCDCQPPIVAADPRREGVCIRCLRRIDPIVLSSNETVKAFYDRLASCLAAAPPEFQAFRAECAERERRGRRTFGLKYMTRQNLTDAKEEAADGANYFFFEILQHLHNEGDEEDIDTALEGALAFFKAHQCAQRLTSKRRGSP